MRISDWSSGVCSSDLAKRAAEERVRREAEEAEARERATETASDGAAIASQVAGEAAVAPVSPAAEPAPSKERPRPVAKAPEEDDERSEEHTSELQSLMRISYAVFCLKKNKENKTQIRPK